MPEKVILFDTACKHGDVSSIETALQSQQQGFGLDLLALDTYFWQHPPV